MRAIIATAAMIVLAACGSDQPTGTTTKPTLTAAQLALHFDTLAGQLKAANPGDIRLQWLQEMVRVIARGSSPSNVDMRIDGGPAPVVSVVEIDQFPTQLNAKLKADSTYIMAAWSPPLRPTQFFDAHVQFLPDSGHADTTRTVLTYYADTTGQRVLTDTTATAIGQVLSERGLCVTTPLTYLSVETNPCIRAQVNWQIIGGEGLAYLNPAAQISGVDLTQ